MAARHASSEDAIDGPAVGIPALPPRDPNELDRWIANCVVEAVEWRITSQQKVFSRQPRRPTA